MNTGGWGEMKVVPPLFPFSTIETEISYIFVKNQKSPSMKHGKEMLEIVGYSLALIIHMVLIMQLAVLLNKSLNII